MANYRAGDVIRMTRMASGMSQEELCFDICSVETLSRIENGKHSVKRITYERLMARMERISEKNYAVCISEDMELLDEYTLLEDSLAKYDYKKADTYLKVLKEKVSNHIVNRQFIMNTEALLDYYNGRIDAEERIKRTKEAARLTVPDYEKYLDKVFPFTYQELMIFMRLANAYLKTDNMERSIPIYQMILRCIDKGYIDEKNMITFRIAVMVNYANAFAHLDQFTETLNLLYQAFDLSLKYKYGYMIPIVLNDIVWTEMEMQKGKENNIDFDHLKRKMRQAYYIAAARKDNKLKANIKNKYSSYFNEKIDLL